MFPPLGCGPSFLLQLSALPYIAPVWTLVCVVPQPLPARNEYELRLGLPRIMLLVFGAVKARLTQRAQRIPQSGNNQDMPLSLEGVVCFCAPTKDTGTPTGEPASLCDSFLQQHDGGEDFP